MWRGLGAKALGHVREIAGKARAVGPADDAADGAGPTKVSEGRPGASYSPEARGHRPYGHAGEAGMMKPADDVKSQRGALWCPGFAGSRRRRVL